MNRTKYKVVSIFLVSTMVVATICSFATFYAHADDDHTNVLQEQIQKSKEQVKKDDALNIVSNSSLTTDTQKITNSTNYTSTNDDQLQNELTSSSEDTTAEKSSAESTESLPQVRRERMNQSYLAKNSSSNVLVDGTWMNAQQGEVWLNNFDYYLDRNVGGVSYVRLLRYKGNSPLVVIPGIINTRGGIRRVSVNNLNANNTKDYLFRDRLQTIQSVKFVEGNWNGTNYKVGVHTGSGAALAFRGASNLQTVSLVGLDFSPTNSPDLNSGGYKQTITDTSYMFQNCPKLTSIQFPDLSTKVSNANYMFQNCTSVNNTGLVNITNFFSTSLKSTTGMFYNTALTSAPNITMENVTDMSSMFQNCNNLTSFDVSNLSNFRILGVKTMKNLFKNCPKLKLVNFSKIVYAGGGTIGTIDTTNMFYTSVETPLILVVPEFPPSLKFNNYNFNGDNRTVNQYPMLNANGGTFSSSNKETLSYFTSCAVNSTQLDMNIFNSWLNKQVPKKTGTTFLRWNTNTTAQTVVDLVKQQAIYSAEWIQMPKTATDNRVLNTQEPLAIAYLPNVFTTGNQPIPLKNSGQQMVPFVKSSTLNIGIRDQRKSNTAWNLTAQLVGNPSNFPAEAYLQVGNQARVTLNINNGTTYNPNLDLKPVNSPVENSNAKITTTPTTIMSKNSSTELNGVYDLNLGNISLVLPNSQNVAVGNYSTTVSWNLVTAP
ncbi:BspA family leucine-rich repeat surface protein [Enterococcus sp. DIV0691]|uniref:BspA family leucine-rich repeat surface protein n=1 Tax=Enterococcus sp. DIV0691 TaxID=2774703 RepID=UPI003F23E622